MNQSDNPCTAMPVEQCVCYAKIQGAGAAAPVRAPTTQSLTSSIGFLCASCNFVSLTATDITRSGAGAYTMKLRDSFPFILDIAAVVWSSTGAAAYKDCYITDYNPSTRVITFGTNLATSGAATDLLSTDFVTFTITGCKTMPPY